VKPVGWQQKTVLERVSWAKAFFTSVMNSTCIHLRAKGPNIYIYRRGENI
jgi:hypothetical protein